MKHLLYIPFLASLLLATLTTHAQSNFIGDSEQPSTSSLIASTNSFLPVEQVYQVAVSIEDSQILFNWSIEDSYYLYRDRFKFNAVDPTTQLQPPLFEIGKRKYDEFFEEELEVYYGQTTVKVPFNAVQGQTEIQIESQGCADAGLCYPLLYFCLFPSPLTTISYWLHHQFYFLFDQYK